MEPERRRRRARNEKSSVESDQVQQILKRLQVQTPRRIQNFARADEQQLSVRGLVPPRSYLNHSRVRAFLVSIEGTPVTIDKQCK